MKKLLFFSFLMCTFVCISCEKEDYPCDNDRPDWEYSGYQRPDTNGNGDSNGDNDDKSNTGNNDSNGDNDDNGKTNPQPGTQPNQNTYTVTKLYSVVMRRAIPYPFQAYVLQINNSAYFYMLRYRFNQDLHVGDKISFGVYSYCQNEIAQINGCDLGDGGDANGNTDTSAGEYLVASDPIEATVKSMFDMKVCYSIPFLPFDTRFIETTDGNLVFIKKSKLNVSLKVGDRFVYNVYTLYPNEILALKKL